MNNIIRKTICYILLICFCIGNINIIPLGKLLFKASSESIITYDDSVYLDKTEFETIELEDYKTKHSKTFRKNNGINEVELYKDAVCYLDNGQYFDIDNTLIENNNYYTNKSNSYNIMFPKHLSKDNSIILNHKNYELEIIYDVACSNLKLDDDIDRTKENINDHIMYMIDDEISIKYDVLSESIKENVILDKFIENFSFSFTIRTSLDIQRINHRLGFFDHEELIFLLNNYVMFDNELNSSNDIDVKYYQICDNLYKFDVTPSNEFLYNARYPVVIDPEIRLVDGGIMDGLITIYENDYLNNTSVFKNMGSFIINNRNSSTLSDDIVADISVDIPRIYNTNLSNILSNNQLMYAYFSFKTLSTSISNDTCIKLEYDNNVIDCVNIHNNIVFDHKFNIIDAVGNNIQSFVNNDMTFQMKMYVEGSSDSVINYSLGYDLSGDKPVITIGYMPSGGLSDYYTYEDLPINESINCYVAHNSGNLVCMINDDSTNPLISVSHSYNTNRSDIVYGRGFDINYNEYLADYGQNISLHLGSGKIIDFISDGTNFISTDGTKDKIIKDFDQNNNLIGYKLSSGNCLKVFNSSGKIIKLYFNENDLNNTDYLTFEYSGNLLTRIIDNYLNKIEFIYSANKLQESKIYKYDSTNSSYNLCSTISYLYLNDNLVKIEKEISGSSNTKDINLTYTNNHLSSIVDDSSYGYNFEYDDMNRVTKATIYNNFQTDTDYLLFSYDKGGRKTIITNSKDQNIKYSFDSLYHTVKIEGLDDYTKFYKFNDIYHNSDGSINNNPNYQMNHKILVESNNFKNSSNIITNHGFEIISGPGIFGWTSEVTGNSLAFINTNNVLYGSHVLSLYKSANAISKVYQSIYAKANTEYVITGYIHNPNTNGGAYINVTSQNETIIPSFQTSSVLNTQGFVRYEYKFTSSVSGYVKVYLVNESNGYAYFDNINVSTDYIDTRYNYLENSSFELNNISGWTGNNYYITNNTMFDDNSLNYSLTLECGGYISQTINKSGNSGDTFVFGGYALGENYTNDIRVYLSFNNLNSHYSKEYKYTDCVYNPEYYMCKYIAPTDYDSITIRIVNNSSSSYAFVDNFSLYEEQFGINITYNLLGDVVSKENEITQTETLYEYDNENRITRITTDEERTDYIYGSNGLLSQVTSNNISTTINADSTGRVIKSYVSTVDSNISYYGGDYNYVNDYLYSTEDVFGNVTSYSYDYLTSLITKISDSYGRKYELSYDEEERLDSISFGNNYNNRTVSFLYDINHNVTEIDFGSTIYTMTYNSYNDIVSISVNNNLLVTTTYDNSGNTYQGVITSQTVNNETIYFEYYDFGLVKNISYGNDKVLEYYYNDFHELSSYIDYLEGITYYYNYDYQNRLISVNTSSGNNIIYSYDDDSRLVSKSNINGSTSYSYQDNSQYQYFIDTVLSEENISNIFKVNYHYTSDGYSNIDVINYYLNNSLIFSKEFTNEVVSKNNAYYYTGRISNIEYTIGNDEYFFDYTYDVYDNITNIKEYLNNTLVYEESNYYDVYNELIAQGISINGETILNEYGYDSRGNMNSFSIQNTTTNTIIHTGSFTYNNKNELVTSIIDGVSYNNTYQNNKVSYYLGRYIYYNHNNISGVINNNLEAMYYYNAKGKRISKTVNGQTTTYILENDLIIKEVKGNNTLQYYYNNNNDLVSFKYNNNSYYYLKNLQNDIIGIIDDNGDIIVRYYYDAYGNTISITDISGINLSTINPFRYRSYYQDSETGWYYLNSRYYDPLVKRFITMDSIDYLGTNENILSYNLYIYCNNNPTSMIDSDGNDAYYVVDFKKGFGLPILGHAVLFYQNVHDEWCYTEFIGSNIFNAVVVNKNTKKKTFEDALIIRRQEGTIDKCWTRFIEGDFTEVETFANNNLDEAYGKYKLFTHNCLHYVKDALSCGSFTNVYDFMWFQSKKHLIIPFQFYSIRSFNQYQGINRSFAVEGAHLFYAY